MNYIDDIAKEIGKECVMEGPEYYQLARIYAVLALSKGQDVTRKDVHDAWSAWMADRDPRHKSLIPFYQLSDHVKAMDQSYVDAIHKVAGMISTLN